MAFSRGSFDNDHDKFFSRYRYYLIEKSTKSSCKPKGIVYIAMIKKDKLKLFLWRIRHPSAARQLNTILRYFDDHSSSGSVNLFKYADISSPLPDHLNDYQAIGALTLFLLSKNTPIPIMIERYAIHDTWEERFGESFLHIAEEVARDFQILGFTKASLRLLGYCQLIAEIIGRPEFAERFKQRKKSIFRGRHPKRR